MLTGIEIKNVSVQRVTQLKELTPHWNQNPIDVLELKRVQDFLVEML